MALSDLKALKACINRNVRVFFSEGSLVINLLFLSSLSLYMCIKIDVLRLYQENKKVQAKTLILHGFKG